ncbi:MAG: PAS domain S-box protein [Candidatus Omnitrophica bacterium]|nr:PAS domain S-box protein [Candidatus Omnitrophota bacterium]
MAEKNKTKEELLKEIKRLNKRIADLELGDNERKKTDALKESEAKYRLLVEMTRTGYLILDGQGRVVDANQEYVRLTGYAELCEILGRSVVEWTAEHAKVRNAEAVAQCAKDGHIFGFITEYADKNGRITFVEINAKVEGEGEALRIVSLCRDITERRKAETVRRDEQKRLRIILDTVGEPIFVKDNDHRIILANQAFYDMFGLDEKAVIGHTLAENVPENERQHFLAVDRGVLDTGVPDVREETLTVNGLTRIIITRKMRFIEQSGARFLVGSIHDITERRKAEDALRESEEQFKNVFTCSAIGMAIVSLEGRWVRVNSKVSSMLGYSQEELLLKTFQDITHPKDLDLDLSYVRQMISGEIQSYMLEKRYFHKNGAIVWVLLAVALVRDSGGTPLYFISQIENITERKKMEEELQGSKAFVEAIVENIPFMVFLKEAEGLRFVLFNRAGEELLGYDRKGLIGKSDLDFFPSEQASFFMAKDREVLDGEAGILDIPQESIQTAKKGERLLHTRKVCLRGADGTAKFLLGISEDITERKKTEEDLNNMKLQIVQSDKLATLGEIAAGMAHEINQPLGGIALVITYFRKLIEKNILSGDKLEAGIKDIEVSVQRMTKTIKHVRDYARQGSMKFTEVDLSETVDSALTLMGEQLRIHGIEVEKTIDPQLPQVMGDLHQIEQVWINFISNARDSMDEKQRQIKALALPMFDYHASLVISGTYQKGSDTVLVTFADNGMGLSEDDIKKIFEPFFTTKEVGKGTGLGLSISQGIIASHHGKIEVEGKKGEGVVFKVYFPVAHAA